MPLFSREIMYIVIFLVKVTVIPDEGIRRFRGTKSL